MKKLFTILAIIISVAGSAFADSKLYYATNNPETVGDYSTITFDDGATLVLLNSAKSWSTGSSVTVGDQTYMSLKLSNGSQNKFTAPSGQTVESVTFYSYINKAAGSSSRISYWKEINGTSYSADDAETMESWKDGKNPDVNSYDINASEFTFTNTGDQVCFVMEVTYANNTPPSLQMTYPQAQTKITEIPDKIIFMFDQEIKSVAGAAIQGGEDDPIEVSADNCEILDGNSVYVNVASCKDLMPYGNVTVSLKLSGYDDSYETNFVFRPEFGLESSTLIANGGQLIFNDNVDFVNPDKVKCYVSGVKTKNIATQATLSLDDDNFAAINVTFADELEAGDYTLDIPESMIMSTDQEQLASAKVPFSIVYPNLQMTYPQANTKTAEIPDNIIFMFDQEIQGATAAAIIFNDGEVMEIGADKCSVKDGNSLYIDVTTCKEALANVKGNIQVSVQLKGVSIPYETNFTLGSELTLESSTLTNRGGQLIFSENIDFVNPDKVKCYVSGVKTKNIATQATLSLDDENFAAVNVEFMDALAPGEYTLDIPDAMIMSVNGEQFTSVKVPFSVAIPNLQQTYPQASTKIAEIPDNIIFMFDQEVSADAIEAVAIQHDYDNPISIDPYMCEVKDGNSLYINVADIKSLMTPGNITVYVQMTGVEYPYETNFILGAEFGIESSKFTANGGQLIFTENVDFVNPEKITCYVSGVKTKNIATQATLSLDDDNYAAINLSFMDELEPGKYTLDIPDGMIMSTSGEQLASVKVEFSIAPVYSISTDSYVGSYYEGKTVDAPLTEILASINAESMDGVTIYSEEPNGTRTQSVRGVTDGWRNAEGMFESWGDNAYFYVQDNSDLPGAQYYVGGMPGHTDNVASYTAKLVYVNNETLDEAILNVTLNYIPAPKVDFKVVATVQANVEYSTEDGSYAEKIVTLNDYQQYTIKSKLGIADLSEATPYGYNPSTKEFVTNYAAYDGWRDINGDFTNWTGDPTTAPYCVKYDNGKDYYCYNIQGATTSADCYWALANESAGTAVLVKVNFKYNVASSINNIFASENSNVAKYNLSGQKVNSSAKGIIIMNGKKYAVK